VNPDGKPAWADISGVQNVVTSTTTYMVSYARNHPQVL
jgi:hypothetical protein